MSRSVAGLGAIALAIMFNVPFAILGATYNYPDVLRGPAGEALDLFAAGGGSLILTWHAFALTALALVVVAPAISITPQRLAAHPGLAIGAALTGALAGLAQAIGLWRWVFVIPDLARAHADPAADAAARMAAERAFSILNSYGGVAIGEHLGQMLTALFVLMLSLLQWREGRKATAGVGFATTAAIAIGANEGVALALRQPGEVFGLITIAGFLGLTVWLIMTGVGMMRAPKVAA